jgi:PAS domain S-box-containing protein
MERLAARQYKYALALVFVVLAAAIRAVAAQWLGPNVPYLLFYPAIMLAAWYGGFGPGLLATLTSAAVDASPFALKSNPFEDTRDLIPLAVFIAVGIIVSRLNEDLHRAVAARSAAAFAQHQLAAIVESSDVAIIGKDLQSVITSWNQAAERLFGYTAADAIGRSITFIIPADRLGEESSFMERIRRGERVDPLETIRLRKDGSKVETSITISPIRDETGAIVGASTIARDITERMLAKRTLEELLDREREARGQAVVASDRLAFLSEVSALLTTSLDYGETLDRTVHLALPRLGDYCNVMVEDHPGDLRHVAWGHVVREKEPLVRDLALRALESTGPAKVPTFAHRIMKAGTTLVVSHEKLQEMASALANQIDPGLVKLGEQLRPYAYVGTPLVVRGRVVGVMSFGTTEQDSRREYTDSDVALVEEFARRVSVAVENARLFRQADELNRLKDEFLATLSHELRTPLSAILGWSRMLSTGQLDMPRMKQASEAIVRNAQAQAKIVDDILDVARGVTGNVPLYMQPVDLVTVALRGIEAIAPAASAKKIDVDTPAADSILVFGDAGRLQQIVWNLLSNAVKFTPSGGRVTVDVGRRNGEAVLKVSDTGSGIPQAFLPFVFDKFRQAEASLTRQHGGLGLGLAIARHLVELHGGTIEARSEGEGRGATFIVRLPALERQAGRERHYNIESVSDFRGRARTR